MGCCRHWREDWCAVQTGPRSSRASGALKRFIKAGGAMPTGVVTCSRKFIPIREMIPEFVVPSLEGFKLKAYVSYKAPSGTEERETAHQLFARAVAPQMMKDMEAGTFDKEQLEKYGLEKTQEGKLFKLYPRNFVR